MKLFLLLFSVLAILPAYGKDNMTFSGTLIDPPSCDINNKENMKVTFKDVGVNKVNGVNYLQPINYTLDCKATAGWTMAMRLSGDASFDVGTIQTDVAGLGIKITIDGKPMELNKDFVINPSTPPILEAVPVKKPGTVLNEGAFYAAATLLAMYQ